MLVIKFPVCSYLIFDIIQYWGIWELQMMLISSLSSVSIAISH